MKHRAEEQLSAFDAEDRSRLEEQCQQLSGLGFKSRWILRKGNPAQETLHVAEEVKAGIIVIGSQGKSAIREWMTGSTTESVVRYARQPVLIVRASKQQQGKAN